MRIRTLSELREVEDRAARFTPLGFSMAGPTAPAAAARMHQEDISDLDLVVDVPDDLRRNFDRLRELHSYGVLHYDLYTIVKQTHPFVLEHALRERFMTHYNGSIPLVSETGDRKLLAAGVFQDVYSVLRRRAFENYRGIVVAGVRIAFNASLRDLVRWARAVGYLRGERNRFRELLLIDLRNRFAHPEGFGIVSPTDSARAIRFLGETINHMWARLTPEGSFYPPPAKREVIAIGSSPDPNAQVVCRARQIGAMSHRAGWTYVLVVGVFEDAFTDFDPAFETTELPCDLLWGPGPSEDAHAWFETKSPSGDSVDPLDRLFAIPVQEGSVGRPRRVFVAANLQREERRGVWHVVRADSPFDAFAHIRDNHESGGAARGPCRECPATLVTKGGWSKVIGSSHHVRSAP